MASEGQNVISLLKEFIHITSLFIICQGYLDKLHKEITRTLEKIGEQREIHQQPAWASTTGLQRNTRWFSRGKSAEVLWSSG